MSSMSQSIPSTLCCSKRLRRLEVPVRPEYGEAPALVLAPPRPPHPGAADTTHSASGHDPQAAVPPPRLAAEVPHLRVLEHSVDVDVPVALLRDFDRALVGEGSGPAGVHVAAPLRLG